MSADFARWTFASLATYLKDVAVAQSLPVLIEGLDARTTAFMESADRCEIRICGPFVRETTRRHYTLEALVNVLFTSHQSETQYAILKKIGAFQEAMEGPIPMCKYGAEPDDDESLLGCFSPIGEIRVLHFGQVDPTTKLRQSMVDARYVVEVEEDV